MRSTKFQFMVMSAFLGLAVAACSPTSDNSLLSDKKDDNSSLTVDKTPKAEELYLKLDTASIGAAVSGTRLEVSGECYTSTYGTHRIIASENSMQLALVDVLSTTPSNTATCRAEGRCINEAQCRNGRFNFSLKVDGMASGGHSVRVSLQAYDGLGVPVYNENQGSVDLSFTR